MAQYSVIMRKRGCKMKVTYYAERINGFVRYFKVNTNKFGQRVAKIEIEKWEYDWAMSK